ncbi:hypothetical protein RDWZM_004243 [Blomia tropicalis]|uniref:Ran GTPase-activating protein 1 n=1 Tax=Blomia tropicalis TaxID=40697 RepID=A0A9Q0RRM0_BLOTA|nr:Ran GTPase-activating protein 1 [Blomia tropicalis]KAJ6225698.1 hypothetical protein RDWZM_004243 [Blomia tropicalis]
MANEVRTTKVSQKFNTVDDVADLIDEIKQKEDSLETLVLEGNSYGIEPLKAIGEALTMCHQVKHLMLNDMFISRLKTEIPEALRLLFGGIMSSEAKIITLNLNDNAIGPVTMPQLLPFLESKSCESLRILRLNNCGLGIRGGQMLSNVLSRLENLQELIIGRNRLEIDGVRDICQSLSNLSHLEILELPQNGTKGDGIVGLTQALASNKNLKVLNLNDNVLKGMDKLLADTVQGLKYLEVLNFGDCLLKTSGCISLMSAIQRVCTTNGVCYLREIILNGNEIGKNAVPSIKATIEQILKSRAHDEIELKIDLSCNNLGEDLVEDLRAQFADSINLIVEDDEGSADEQDDDEPIDLAGDENVNLNQSNNGDVLDVEQLIIQYDSNFQNLKKLAEDFFLVSSKGFRNDLNNISDRSKIEVEAIIKVGLKYQLKNHGFDFINELLIVCGLLKSEDKKSKTYSSNDLRGPVLALAFSLKFLNDINQKKCIRVFLKKVMDDEKYDTVRSNLLSFVYSF